MSYSPFKMKGNPMQRNFGIGSPLHADTNTWDKIKAAASAVTSSLGKVNTANYPLSERISDKYKAKKAEYREKAKNEEDEKNKKNKKNKK